MKTDGVLLRNIVGGIIGLIIFKSGLYLGEVECKKCKARAVEDEQKAIAYVLGATNAAPSLDVDAE